MVTKKISGYKYTTIEEFKTDESICNDAKGFPMPDCITTTFISYDENLDEDGAVLFYYVVHFDELTELIGDPIEIDINIFE